MEIMAQKIAGVKEEEMESLKFSENWLAIKKFCGLTTEPSAVDSQVIHEESQFFHLLSLL